MFNLSLHSYPCMYMPCIHFTFTLPFHCTLPWIFLFLCQVQSGADPIRSMAHIKPTRGVCRRLSHSFHPVH
ncbi:hypothetical protein DL96DRAFT_71929 [Flagelloscypha sp. PMI_526]|nr:hypothetical protein DL96DRAFT_71929 [Flagelloscypha sp. PMI_526]